MLIKLSFIAGIIGEVLCQLGENEVYPLSTVSKEAPNNCPMLERRRLICGRPGITERECREIGCCWNDLGVLRCFKYEEEGKQFEAEIAEPHSTTYPVFPSIKPTDFNKVSAPISFPHFPQLKLNQTAHLSTLSSEISYSGCLLHCTSLPESDRRICLYDASKDLCLQVGCCYDERMNQCFHSNGVKDPCPATEECQVTFSPAPKCGDFPKDICEEVGCCYNTISGVPACYRKQAVGRQDSPTPPPPPPPPATLDFEAEFKKFQELLNKGELSSLLPANMPAPAAAPAGIPKPKPPSKPNPPPTAAPAVPATTSILDQINQIQQLLEAGVLPTLIPPNATRATTTTGTTRPPKTAPLVQKWKPRPLYETKCDKNGFCRYVVKSCLPPKCGDPPINPATRKISGYDPRKIVGGSRAYPYSHPWTVMIQKTEGNRTFVCGGTVICERWVVTAAHCLDQQGGNSNEPDLNPDKYKLYFGRYIGLRSRFGRQVQVRKGRRDIAALIQHENFIPGKHRGVITHDVALIKLALPVVFNEYTHPICLPREKAPINKVMYATGWGITRGIGPDASSLKQLGVQIKSATSCRNRVPGFRNPVGVLCGGGEPNHDTCTGDSGGPLVGSKLAEMGRNTLKGKHIFYFYGLTSIGSPSCNTRQYDRQPALYTDIHYYVPWIRKNTADCCS